MTASEGELSVDGQGLTVEDLLDSLRRRRAALPAEIGTFVVFEVCELLLSGAPVKLLRRDVFIHADGRVSVMPSAVPADDAEAARSVHRLLAAALVTSRPSLPPTLLRLVEDGPATGGWSLAELRDELEGALVPLNRTACRRVLARLLREAESDRAWGAPIRERSPSFDELDAELDDLLGESSAASSEPGRAGAEVDARAGLGQADGSQPAGSEEWDDDDLEPPTTVMDISKLRQDPEYVGGLPEAGGGVMERALSTPLVGSSRLESTDLSLRLREVGAEESRAPSALRPLLWGLGLALVAGGVFVAVVEPPLPWTKSAAVPPPNDDPLPVFDEWESEPKQQLSLGVAPSDSQVLEWVGSAPVKVPNVPVGVEQEFVAVLQGHRPARVRISPDATWQETEQGPYLELAMQPIPAKGADAKDLGKSSLQGTPGRPTGQGVVRILTTPHGARIYRIIGFGPEVVLNRPGHGGLELLIYRPKYRPITLELRSDDWTPSVAGATVRRSVTLERRPEVP